MYKLRAARWRVKPVCPEPGRLSGFPERTVDCSPRLWIARAARKAFHVSSQSQAAAAGLRRCQDCCYCNVHMLWKNLLITCGGLG